MLFNVSIPPLSSFPLSIVVSRLSFPVPTAAATLKKSAVMTMSVHKSAGAVAAAAAAAVLCLASETFERLHPWRGLTTIHHHDKWNSVLWHN